MELNHSGRNKSKSAEKITVDAIHPLFNAYRNQKSGTQPPEDDDRYFCKECQVFFPMFDVAVTEHFQNRTHYPIESCIYCEGPVCEYFFKNQRKFFHNCEEKNVTKDAEAEMSIKKRFTSHSCDIS